MSRDLDETADVLVDVCGAIDGGGGVGAQGAEPPAQPVDGHLDGAFGNPRAGAPKKAGAKCSTSPTPPRYVAAP